MSSSSKEEGYQDEKNDDKNDDIIETIDNYSGIQSNIIDVRSAQKVQETSNSTSFPNPAYEAFVQLVTKHKLADSVANDIILTFIWIQLQLYHQMRKQRGHCLIR